jgi:pyruvate/2-oxoglutarate dehydrogenase complex dihydrolipoamide acyltransferase (E2) component
MFRAIRTPRINNNDDSVRLTRVAVEVGAEVHIGDFIAEIETDKANFSVESEDAGFVLAICHEPGESIAVGSVLMWLGDSPNEQMSSADAPKDGNLNAPTTGGSLKAQLLLRQWNLNEAVIPRAGSRLTAGDVERYIQANGLTLPATAPRHLLDGPPSVSGKTQDLNPQERGMLRSVLWHRDSAVPGYLELPYDARPWAAYAAAFQKSHKLMFDPLLSLLAFRLVGLARQHTLLNSTINGESRHLYDHVNLGFTVQSSSTLYMVVVRNAEMMTEKEFAGKLMALQMAAMRKSLRPEETTGATLAFTSMARWPVTRHIPILPPYVSFIVAHTAAAADGSSHWGATYDHRVLTGFDAAQLLVELSRPPEASDSGEELK